MNEVKRLELLKRVNECGSNDDYCDGCDESISYCSDLRFVLQELLEAMKEDQI